MDLFAIINDTTYIADSALIYRHVWFLPAVIVLLFFYYYIFRFIWLYKEMKRFPSYSPVSGDDADGLIEYVSKMVKLTSYCFREPLGETSKKAKSFHKEMPRRRLRCVLWVINQLGFEVMVYRLDKEEEADAYLRSIGAEDVKTWKPGYKYRSYLDEWGEQ